MGLRYLKVESQLQSRPTDAIVVVVIFVVVVVVFVVVVIFVVVDVVVVFADGKEKV